jgi:hypothetical protein
MMPPSRCPPTEPEALEEKVEASGDEGTVSTAKPRVDTGEPTLQVLGGLRADAREHNMAKGLRGRSERRPATGRRRGITLHESSKADRGFPKAERGQTENRFQDSGRPLQRIEGQAYRPLANANIKGAS